ncbi:MAG: tetratricopeptide repeat protein, partial [bacterium]|nr:tetratricopeptide repeat protein [bacterium]
FSEKISKYELTADEVNKKSLFPFIGFVRRFFNADELDKDRELSKNFDKKLDELISKISLTKKSMVLSEGFKEVLKGFSGIELTEKWKNLDAKARNDLTESALIELFKLISFLKPVVFVFEDYHFIDSESKKIAGRIIHNMSSYNCLFIISCRPMNGEDNFKNNDEGEFSEIQLSRFNREEMFEFLKDRFLYKTDKKLFEYIFDKSSGNPFYAEQICLYLLENDFIGEHRGFSVLKRDVKNVPTTIYSLVISRIDKLKKSLKELVKKASVIGTEFEVKILSEMLIREDLGKGIKSGENSGIWSPLSEIKYIFKHSLIRDAAYEMQLKKELEKLHIMAAGALERIYKEDMSKNYDIAIHYDRGGNAMKAKENYRRAGEFAVENFRNSEAVTVFERMIELSDDFREKFKSTVSLVNVFELTSSWKKGAEILEQTLKNSFQEMTDLQIGESKLKLSYLKLKMGEIGSVLHDFEEAERIFKKESDLEKLMSVHNFQGVAFTRLGEFEKALEKFEELRIESQSVSHKNNIKRIISESLVNKGFAYQELERFDSAMECFIEALKIAEELKDKRLSAQTLVNMGNISFFKRDLDKAEEIYLRQLELDKELGDKYIERVILNNLGALESIRFNLKKAIEYIERSLELSRYINEKRGERIALGNLGSCRAILGEFAKAEENLNDSLKISRMLCDSKGVAVALDTLSKLYMETGRTEDAARSSEEALKITEEYKLKSLFLSVSITLSQILLMRNECERGEKLAYEAFEKSSVDKNVDEHARVFIVKERFTEKKNPKEASENLEKYENAASTKGAKGMFLMELYFITGRKDLKEEALELLGKAYKETSDYQYKKYCEFIERERRPPTI